MESRLPKPSGWRKPATNTMLPMDRIRAGGNKAAAPINGNVLKPLPKEMCNFSNINAGRKGRAPSPEHSSQSTLRDRPKLRRSRSACDIHSMQLTTKRTANMTTLATIPPKSARLAPTCTVPANRLARGVTTTTVAAPMVGGVPKRPGTTAPVRSNFRTGTAAAVNNTAKTVTGASSNATVVAKTAPKRIAPYDFKARYQDLLEKHKALREKHQKVMEDIGDLETLPTQLEESQNQLFETEQKLKNVEANNESLQQQVKAQTIKLESVTSTLGRIRNELTNLETIYNKIKPEYETLSVEVVDLRERNAHLIEDFNMCKEQLFNANMERKELHNVIMDLRGNIRVFCRVRPPLSTESERLVCGWSYQDEATVEISNLDVSTRNKLGQFTFSFDQVFNHHSSQAEIFELVSPLIQSALDGYNICIFAYGQTGSGKTYTMDGVADSAGVIPRTVDLIFDAIKNYKNLGWEYQVKATFLEIYNEVLYDLLSNEPKEMEIRMSKNSKHDIYVTNLTEETVTTPNQLRQLMHTAKLNRATAATAGNERSSRSHAVTKLELIGEHAEKQEISIGSINLVDLAGSESPKTSNRMTETKNINRSLSELTNVILALLQKQDHIPYRNSKLTHLLMPSLGGNSKTLMFINVAPFQDCFQESVKSLRFAASVNSCKMAKAKRVRYLNSTVVANSSTCSDK